METNNKQNKCILLVRVSSYVQNYEAQMDDLIKYAEKLGYTKENQIIIANKESGKLSEEEREGLTEMFQYLESDAEKRINAVFVWEVSRIGRNGETLDNVKNYLIKRHTQLFVYKPTIQLLDEDGITVNFVAKIVFELLATMAQQENFLKTERTMRTRRENVKNGKVSSGSVLFGYCTDKDGYVMIDEEGGTADIIRTIYTDYLKGEKSVIQIYENLEKYGKLPHQDEKPKKRDYINMVLSNPSYCGRQREGVVIKSGKNKGQISGSSSTKYPAIITEETWDMVAEKRRSRKAEKNATKHIFFGKGIVDFFEGERHERMIGKSCTATYYADNIGVAVSANLIDSILWEEAKHAKMVSMDREGKEHKEQLERHLEEVATKIKIAEKNIIDYHKKIDKTNKLYIDERLSEEDHDKTWKTLNHSLKEEERWLETYKEQRVSLISQLEAINRNEKTIVSENDINVISTTDEAKAAIIREMVKRVEVRKKDNITTIALHNEYGKFSNTYIYGRVGRSATLYIENNGTTTPLDYNTFVVKRIERKAYPKKAKK